MLLKVSKKKKNNLILEVDWARGVGGHPAVYSAVALQADVGMCYSTPAFIWLISLGPSL